MDWLNYHHLYYFWLVAREGSVTGAAKKARLSHPTISAQVRALERALGEPLLEKRGRGVGLTDMGHLAFGYADEIFALGRELSTAMAGRVPARSLRVGIAQAVPKLIAFRVLSPATEVRLTCVEGSTEHLLTQLAQHELDLVLSDGPVPTGVQVAAHAHLLGESPVAIFAERKLQKRLKEGFPRSLHGERLLLPAPSSPLRHALDAFFDAQAIRPEVAGEFEDTALMKSFGQAGVGAFAGPAAIEDEIERQYDVVKVGQLESVVERFYLVTADRRLKHPIVTKLRDRARERLFGVEGDG